MFVSQMEDDDPFSEASIAPRPTKTSSPRALTKWEQQQEDAKALRSFLESIGEEDSLDELNDRGWTWEKMKTAHEEDILQIGLKNRLAKHLVEELKKLPNTRLGMSSAKKKVVNMDVKQDIDFEKVPTSELPKLPSEAPPITCRVEYKNYMRLRYEYQKRGLLEEQVIGENDCSLFFLIFCFFCSRVHVVRTLLLLLLLRAPEDHRPRTNRRRVPKA